jgi:DNA modification methylase
MELNTVVNADCIEWLAKQREPFIDLAFADPPFNIGYLYDVYEDRKAYHEYYTWTEDWMGACCGALKPTGSFWIAIGDEYAAEVRMIGRKLGLTLRNWVIWHYTFGQNTKRKFARSHAHLFYFVKDPKEFTFNDEAVRVFSDRQREYHDKRANPAGKIPDDTWDVFPRVCGTFGEREGWHPCQMPESVLSRIVRVSSNVGDVVFDPFAGSGTTLVAASKLSRRYLGTEISHSYVKGAKERLARTTPIAAQPADPGERMPEAHRRELQAVYMEASVATDLLHAHRHLLDAFVSYFNWRLANAGVKGEYPAKDVWGELERMRKNVQLPRIKVHGAEAQTPSVRPPPTPSATHRGDGRHARTRSTSSTTLYE